MAPSSPRRLGICWALPHCSDTGVLAQEPEQTSLNPSPAPLFGQALEKPAWWPDVPSSLGSWAPSWLLGVSQGQKFSRPVLIIAHRLPAHHYRGIGLREMELPRQFPFRNNSDLLALFF